MKKSILYKILAIVFAATMLNSCQEDQEVAPVQSTANYPVATYEVTSGDITNMKKGDVIVYTITLDRMSNTNISFGIELGDNSEITEDDLVVEGGTMAAFSKETTLTITLLQG